MPKKLTPSGKSATLVIGIYPLNQFDYGAGNFLESILLWRIYKYKVHNDFVQKASEDSSGQLAEEEWHFQQKHREENCYIIPAIVNR